MTSPTGRRLALFVANDTFHSPGIPRLHAPVSDATQLRELLRDPEIGAFAPAEILVNESKAEIERGIERLFRGAGPEDVVLFYFSGHGIRTRHNLYLATSNTDTQLISSSAVSASFIKELIRESAAAAKIILLDCCYSGAFLGGDVIKAQPTVDDVGHELAAGEGICVLTAATAVQVAGDGGAERSAPLSVFTSAVVKGIATGLADNGTGVINTHSLWSYVSAEVRGRTSRQTPSHYGVLQEEVHIARTRRRLPLPDIRDLPAEAAVLPEMTDGAADLVTRVALAHRGEGAVPVPVPGAGLDGDNDFAALYRITDPADPELGHRWQPKNGSDRLRIPVGIDSAGRPVLLDFKQAAEEGWGRTDCSSAQRVRASRRCCGRSSSGSRWNTLPNR